MKRKKIITLCTVTGLMLLTACASSKTTKITLEMQEDTTTETKSQTKTKPKTETKPEMETETETETETEKETETTTEETYIPGSNQSDAVLVPLGTKVFGTVKEDGNVWFAFTTDDTQNATYNIT